MVQRGNEHQFVRERRIVGAAVGPEPLGTRREVDLVRQEKLQRLPPPGACSGSPAPPGSRPGTAGCTGEARTPPHRAGPQSATRRKWRPRAARCRRRADRPSPPPGVARCRRAALRPGKGRCAAPLRSNSTASKLMLELAYLHRHRRLGDPQVRGGAGDALRLRGEAERPELPQPVPLVVSAFAVDCQPWRGPPMHRPVSGRTSSGSGAAPLRSATWQPSPREHATPDDALTRRGNAPRFTGRSATHPCDPTPFRDRFRVRDGKETGPLKGRQITDREVHG